MYLHLHKLDFPRGRYSQSDLSFSPSPQVIILIGNKADLEAQRDVTYEEAKQFAEENGEKGLGRAFMD